MVEEIKVERSEGARAAAPFETGELWVKGPNVATSYWRRPESTAAAMHEGWFRTGDLAYLDEEGYAYVVDRSKEMVTRGSKSVFTTEVESAISMARCVKEVAVLGVQDIVMGEEIAAVVVLKPAFRLSPAELREELFAQTDPAKVPKYLFIHEGSLPRDDSGGVARRRLREEIASKLLEAPPQQH